MSLRPPSNIRPYDDFFSGDPAIVQSPPDATKEQIADRAHRIQVARETGAWNEVVVDGREPTRFVMQPLRGNFYRTLMDEISAGRVGAGKASQIAFRAAVKGVVNLGDREVGDRVETDKFGSLAPVEFTDYLDSIDLSIVSELGGEALRRARDLAPK